MLHCTAKFRENPPSQLKLFELSFDEEPRGSRPPCLGEPWGPQERVQQRTLEQLADVVPMVQILDIPLPQIVDQLVASLLHLDVEQTVDIPVGAGGLSGIGEVSKVFSPDSVLLRLSSRSLTFQWLALRLDLEVFKIYTQNRVQQRFPSRTLTFQLLVVVFKVLIQISVPAVYWDDP